MIHYQRRAVEIPEKPIIIKTLRTMPITRVTLASVNAGTSSHILCNARSCFSTPVDSNRVCK